MKCRKGFIFCIIFCFMFCISWCLCKNILQKELNLRHRTLTRGIGAPTGGIKDLDSRAMLPPSFNLILIIPFSSELSPICMFYGILRNSRNLGKTSPHTKCHQPSLLFTSLAIATSLTFVT